MVYGTSVKHTRGQRVGLDHILAVSPSTLPSAPDSLSNPVMLSLDRTRMLFLL